jgi:hypothetical protein
MRTVANNADDQGNGAVETVRANRSKRNGEDRADDADDNHPPQSAPGKKGWSAII